MAFRKSSDRNRVKLIFNPGAGAPEQSAAHLLAAVEQLQGLGRTPEVFIVQKDCNIAQVVQSAYAGGIRSFVVSGGDGTVESVAAHLQGLPATLAIIPTGTRNNVARSLHIPAEIPQAVALLAQENHLRVDMGMAACCGEVHPFLEFCTAGLISTLFPAADDLQKGNLLRLGDLLSALVNSPINHIRLLLDGRWRVETDAYVVLAANMPYLGANYQVAPDDAYMDGRLNVMVFSNLSKLELLSTAVQVVTEGDDPRIQQYRVRSLELESDPPMPIMADGVELGQGPLKLSLRPRSLRIVAGSPTPPAASEPSGS